MTGLVLQKFLSLKKAMQFYLLFIIFYGIIGVASGNISFVSGFLVLFSSFIPISVFTVEDRSKWDLYANVMPVTRKQIVRSQYAFFGVIILIVLLLDLIISAAEIATGQESLIDAVQISYGFLAISILVQLTMIPIFIRFGSTVAQVAIAAICMIPTLTIIILSKLNVPLPSLERIKELLPYSPILLILLALLSYYISLYFYKKKDL